MVHANRLGAKGFHKGRALRANKVDSQMVGERYAVLTLMPASISNKA